MRELERFGRYLRFERARSPATCAAYTADVELLLDLAQGRPLDSLGRLAIVQFVREMRKRGLDGRTIARRLAAWRTFYRAMRMTDGWEVNPAADVKAPRWGFRLPYPINRETVSRFLDGLDDKDWLSLRDRAMFELAYSSGLRVSELVGVNHADFTSDLAMLRVRGKGGRERDVPVGSYARRAIATWIKANRYRSRPAPDDHGALFVTKQGKRLSVGAVQSRCHVLSKQFGLADVLHPHRFRHACATHFLEESGDLRATQELLGHVSIRSTAIYTHLDIKALRKVYDKAHPRAKAPIGQPVRFADELPDAM